MIALRVLRQLGQHSLQRQLHIAKKPQLQPAAIAQRFGSQVDLRDVAVPALYLRHSQTPAAISAAQISKRSMVIRYSRKDAQVESRKDLGGHERITLGRLPC